MRETNSTILCLYPNTYGVAYAIFDSPKKLIDYGMGHIRPVCSKKSLLRVQKYIGYYKPDVVLVRELSCKKMNKRTQKLIEKICDEVKSQGLGVHRYSREQIRQIFAQFEKTSKYQIHKKILEWFPKMKGLEFSKRKRWMSECPNIGVFDAVALGLVHYYLTE